MFDAPAISVSSASGVLVVAQPRDTAATRRRGADAAVRWNRNRGVRGAVRRIVLADTPAEDVRRARGLSAAARIVVAVPHVPVVPRVQRRRDGALDVLPVRRPAAAAGGADRSAAVVPRAV